MKLPKSQEVILEQMKVDLVAIIGDVRRRHQAWGVAYLKVGIGPTADGAMVSVLSDEQGVAVFLDDEEVARV